MPSDALLSKAKDLLFRSWIRESRFVRSPLMQLNAQLQNMIDPNSFTKDGGRMYKTAADQMARKIRRDMASAFDQADLEIQRAVERAASRASLYQKKFLQGENVQLLGNDELRRIQAEAVKMLNKEFPEGSGIRYRDRMASIRRRHEKEMLKTLRASYARGDAMGRIERDFKVRLTNNKVGVRSPVSGGSVSKQVSRVMVAEEARISQETEKRVLKAHGIEYAYWRLSPDHRWENGAEICEQIAAGTGVGVRASITRSTSTSKPIVMEGLYKVESWPEYPHPYCKCHMEPFV